MPPVHPAVENVFPVPGDATLELCSEARQHIDKARSIFAAIPTQQQPQFAAMANILAALCWELRYLRVNIVGFAVEHQRMGNQLANEVHSMVNATNDLHAAMSTSAPNGAGD